MKGGCTPVRGPKSPAKTGLGRSRGSAAPSHTTRYTGGKKRK